MKNAVLEEKAAQPKFVVGGVGAQFTESSATYRASMRNVGNTATALEVTLLSPDLGNHSLGKVPSLSRGEDMQITINYRGGAPKSASSMLVTYTDAENLPGEVRYRVTPVYGGPNVMLNIERE